MDLFLRISVLQANFYWLKYFPGADLGLGCRGCPPPPEMTRGFPNTTGIVQKKNYVVYWC